MKLKIRKYFFYLIILVFITGCASNVDQTPTDNNQDETTSEVYDIVWWGLFDSPDIIQPLIDNYTQNNPNININYVQITDGIEDDLLLENYITRLDENLIDNEPLDTPDIITIHNTWLGKYSKYLSPAPSNIIDVTTISDNYYPVVATDFVRGSSVYGVPLYMDSIALIVNKNLLTKQSAVDSDGPSNNWFDFKDQTERLTSRDAEGNITIAGFSAGSANVEFLTPVVSTMMMQSNIEMTKTDPISGFSSEAVFADDNESQTVLEFYQKFSNESDKNSWDSEFDNEIVKFLKGELVVYAGPAWRLNEILLINDLNNLGIDVDVYQLPQIDPTNSENNFYPADYWALSVTSDSQKRGQSNEVWKFIEYLNQDVQLLTLNQNVLNDSLRSLGIIFAKPSLNGENKTNKSLGAYVNSLEFAKTWDMIDGFEINKVFKSGFDNEINATQLQSNVNTIINNRTNLLDGNTAQ